MKFLQSILIFFLFILGQISHAHAFPQPTRFVHGELTFKRGWYKGHDERQYRSDSPCKFKVKIPVYESLSVTSDVLSKFCHTNSKDGKKNIAMSVHGSMERNGKKLWLKLYISEWQQGDTQTRDFANNFSTVESTDKKIQDIILSLDDGKTYDLDTINKQTFYSVSLKVN